VTRPAMRWYQDFILPTCGHHVVPQAAPVDSVQVVGAMSLHIRGSAAIRLQDATAAGSCHCAPVCRMLCICRRKPKVVEQLCRLLRTGSSTILLLPSHPAIFCCDVHVPQLCMLCSRNKCPE